MLYAGWCTGHPSLPRGTETDVSREALIRGTPEKAYSQFTFREMLPECGPLVHLSLNRAVVRSLRRELSATFPDQATTNEGAAREGTHTCNPSDVCLLVGPFARDWRRGHRATRSEIHRLLKNAEREWSNDDGRKVRLT